MVRWVRVGLLGILLATAPAAASFAQAELGVWEDGETNLFVGNLDFWWASNIARAANEWNRSTNFDFKIKGNGYAACDRYDSGVLLRGDEHVMTNGVEFNDTMCGMEDFEPNVLAVCQFITAEGSMQQAGLVFNDFWSWDVFHGPNGDTTFDFHRVAVHELGHFLGLDHSDLVSIMQPIVSDEIEDIQPADITAVNSAYGPDGPIVPDPPVDPDPDPDPQTACQVNQLRAGAKLCKAQLSCQAKHAKDPAKDADGAKRDACASLASAAFTAAWDAEVATAAAVGGCHAQDPGIDVSPAVGAASAGAIQLIGSGDAANPDDRALRTKLLKKAAALCGESFGAWKKEALVSDATKLGNSLARSRAKFAGAADKAIANARALGVSYDGANEQLIADELESLANELGQQTGPE